MEENSTREGEKNNQRGALLMLALAQTQQPIIKTLFVSSCLHPSLLRSLYSHARKNTPERSPLASDLLGKSAPMLDDDIPGKSVQSPVLDVEI